MAWRTMLMIPGHEAGRESRDWWTRLLRDNEEGYGIRMQQYRDQLTHLGNAGVAAFTAPLIALGMLAACTLQLVFIVSITGLVHVKHHAQQCSWMRADISSGVRGTTLG